MKRVTNLPLIIRSSTLQSFGVVIMVMEVLKLRSLHMYAAEQHLASRKKKSDIKETGVFSKTYPLSFRYCLG